MTPTRSQIRSTAALYLLMGLPGAFNLKHLPSFVVRGDAAATARNIADASLSYRLTIVSGVVGYLAEQFNVGVVLAKGRHVAGVEQRP